MKPEDNDLFITRTMKNVTRDQLWRAWTDPKILEQWWCPKPWTVKDVNIELRPGGASQMVMCGPNGEEMPQNGCIVYVKEKECIVFTDCMEKDWRPTGSSFMTAIITMKDCPGGVEYSAIIKHKSDEDKKKHEEMGFHPGWGKVFEQLEETARGL